MENGTKELERRTSKIKQELKGRIKTSFSGFLRVCLIGLLVFIQISIIIMLPFILSNFTVYFYVILEIFSFIIILLLVNDKRSSSYKVAWISIVLLLPISGHVMYWLWGKSNSNQKIEKRIIAKLEHGTTYLTHSDAVVKEFTNTKNRQARMVKYLESEHFPLFKNNEILYFSMGEDAFEAMFQDLEQARHFIFLDFFIVAEGALWDKIHEILLTKIKQGVEVKFLYDDFGATIRTNKYFKRDLEEEGFEVRIFNPIHNYTEKLYINYRSHQKIVVIDGNIGYTGGFNIADEYANLIERFGIWKDNGVRLVGDAVWGLTVTFLQMWEVCEEETPINYNPYRPTANFAHSDVYCQVISDGPANNPNNPIERIYKLLIHYSYHYLYITTPYLIIEDDMKDALITAAKTGVDVRIITPNIPDKKNVKLLTNFNYGALLEGGVRIFEYTPGFIHAKTIITDDCGVIGSINMDYRSFYLHYENGIFISHKETIETIKEDLLAAIKESREITYEEWKNRPAIMKAKQMLLNLFSTLM